MAARDTDGDRRDMRRSIERDALRHARRDRTAASFWRSLSVLGTVGWSIALPTAGGRLLGHHLDRPARTGVRLDSDLAHGGRAGRRRARVARTRTRPQGNGNDVRVFGECVLVYLGPVPVTATMLASVGVSVVLVAAALALRHAVARRPESALSALAVLTVEWLDGMVREIAGRPEPRLVTLSGSLFLYIAGANLSGLLPGVHRPTASLAATSALAAVVFAAVPLAGIAARGVGGYLAHYLRPIRSSCRSTSSPRCRARSPCRCGSSGT